MSRFGGKSTSALLQKVSSKLRGESTKPAEDDDGLQAYLSGLSKTSKTQASVPKPGFEWDRFGEVSDLSLSEDEPIRKSPAADIGTSGSKFLKKRPAAEEEGAEGGRRGIQSGQKSAALSRVSGLSTKYEGRGRQEAARQSGSDADFSFSIGGLNLGDVEALTPAITPRHDKSASEDSMSLGKKGSRFMKKASQVEEPHAAVRQTSAEKPKTNAGLQKPAQQGPASSHKQNTAAMAQKPSQWPSLQQKKPVTFDVDEESSSMSIGKGGSKFMKKKAPTEKKVSPVQSPKEQRKRVDKEKAEKTQAKQDKSPFRLKTADRYSTTVHLDSDEESLQGFIKDLASSPSEVSLKSPPKSPKTPRGILKTPRTPHSAGTLEDIHEERGNTTLSEDDSFKTDDSLASTVIDIRYDSAGWTTDDVFVNLLDLDALEFSPPEPQPSHTTSSKDKVTKDKVNKDKVGKDKVSKTKPAKSPSKKKDGKKAKSRSRSGDRKQSSRSVERDEVFGELFTVEDLLGRLHDSDTEQIATDLEDESAAGRSPSPLRSILSPSPKLERTPRSSRTRVHYSLDDLSPRSPSPEVISTARLSKSASMVYSDDFDDASIRSDIRTDPASEVESVSEYLGQSQTSYTRSPGKRRSESDYYSDDFTSATESRWNAKRREYALSHSESADSEFSAYSDTFSEVSESNTISGRHPRRGVTEKQVQTGSSLAADLTYHWRAEQAGVAHVSPGYGLGNTDPKLIATHVVSADALEAMTGYSPSVLALNEMLRQQLQLTENYISTQNTLYQSLIHSTRPDYVYTTLEDTKRYIKKNRKPKLTFDEALRQVKQEMGLEK